MPATRVYIDPRLLRYIEDRRKAVYARTGMDANAGVIPNHEFVLFILLHGRLL
jgi:hypothetical protein